MPISPSSAGTDAAQAPYPRPGNPAGDLVLGDRGRVPGPFQLALTRATAPAIPSASAPAASQTPAPETYEGTQALSALRRDLLGNAGVPVQDVAAAPVAAPVSDVSAAAVPVAAPPPDPAAVDPVSDAPVPSVEPDQSNAWRNDETKGRRLGDRPAASAEDSEDAETWLFGEDGFGFDDLVDVINPLQHIPIVSTVYRWLTGDEIAPAASVAGGALFGGPIGMAGAMAGVAIEEATGRDLGGHAMAMMFGDGASPGGGSPSPADTTDMAALPATGIAAANLAALPDSAVAPGDPADIPELPFFPRETATTVQQARVEQPDTPARDAPPATAPVAAGFPLPPADAEPILFIPANPALTAMAPAAGTPAAPLSPADAVIATQMMLALDKYAALGRQRGAAPGAIPASQPAAGALYDSRF